MTKTLHRMAKKGRVVGLTLVVIAVLALSIPLQSIYGDSSSVQPVGSGVTPTDGSTLTGTQTFIFPFESTTGSLTELEMDIYLGDDAGDDSSDYGSYANSVTMNLPANSSTLATLINTVNTGFKNSTREAMVTYFGGGTAGEYETRVYEAVGFRCGKDMASTVLSNITYTAGVGGAGTWNLTLDTYKLQEAAFEVMVAVKDNAGGNWGDNNVSHGDVKAFWYALTESAVEPTAAITPAPDSTLYGLYKFTFPFRSTHGDLDQLELDIYLGDNTGATRSYSYAVSMNLPADAAEVGTLIEGVNSVFMSHTRDELVTIFGGGTIGENEVKVYEAVGFAAGEDRADIVKENIVYTGTASEGAWVILLDLEVLDEDAMELLIAVKNDDGMQWGNNNFAFYGAQTQAYYYDIVAVPHAAGGEVSDIDKSALMIPGLVLFGLVLAGGIILFGRRKAAAGNNAR